MQVDGEPWSLQEPAVVTVTHLNQAFMLRPSEPNNKVHRASHEIVQVGVTVFFMCAFMWVFIFARGALQRAFREERAHAENLRVITFAKVLDWAEATGVVQPLQRLVIVVVITCSHFSC
jgi:hypothetical protein